MSLDLNRALADMYKQRKQQSQPNNKKPKVEELAATKDFSPKATFDQLYGCETNRDQIVRIINCFKKSIVGQAKKLEWPILISGSNRLGKTSIVEAAANYAKLRLIPLFLKKLSPKTRSELQIHLEQFCDQCLANQPAIVLVDDIDRLNGKEDKIDLITDVLERLLSEDLDLLVFCTSSTIIDEHFNLQFSISIQLKRPDSEARFHILNSLIKKYPNLDELGEQKLKTIALDTPSFTPLDLRKMLEIASIESQGCVVTLEHCTTAINIIKQSFKQGTHLIGEKPTTTWGDIGGMTDVRLAFLEILQEIKTGDVDCQFAGIALYGPPGCGKTMVAKAMANEAGFNFISINPTELQNKFFGETERNIRKVFREAREYEPCVIYFDEFDGLCGTRGSKDNMTNAIQTLLSEMDGFASRGKSIILASTNRLEDIDPAMKRPGRLSKHIYVGRPGEKERRDILEVLVKRHQLILAQDVNLSHWAKSTTRFTGADLAFLIYEAKPKRYMTGDNNKMQTGGDLQEVKLLKQAHLEAAYHKLIINNPKLKN